MTDISSITTDLRRDSSGIWVARDEAEVSYPDDGNESCFAVEEKSFWFRHRNRCIVSAVNSFPPPDGETIFDIGGGNGFVSMGLAEAGYDVVLVEPGRAGALNARKRGVKNIICATTDTANFRERSMSAVGLFDVIEHIDDDVAFLKSISVLLKHNGLIYATVPAYASLWSQEDVYAGHFRRYTLTGFCDTLRSSGFQILFASCIFRFLPVPVFLFRSLPYKLGLSKVHKAGANVSRDHAVSGGLFAFVMNGLLKPEIENLKNRKAMAFGGSCLVVAQCPGQSRHS